MIIKDMYQEYEDYQKQSKTSGTAGVRCGLIKKYAFPVIGELEFERACSSHIAKIYRCMEEQGLRQNTLYGMQAALRSYFKFALDRGYTVSNPMLYAKRIYTE